MTDHLTDTQFEEHVLDDVRDEVGGWAIGTNHWTLWIDKVPGVEPKVGSVARFYGRGTGFPVRGVVIDGQVAYYRTEAEEADRHRQWVEDNNREKQAAALANAGETARRLLALPDSMQRRIDKFRQANPNFDWEYLPYELMVCEDAVKIADALATPAERPFHPTAASTIIQGFAGSPPEEQRRLVPTLEQGHSGNSFGMACRLAFHLITDEENAVREHGALVSLVGCEAYGCPHPEASDA